jgi:DNA-binding MarR family transcriptional regulator
MTRIVTALEKDWLVQRIGDVRDRRLTRIQATAKGQRILAAGRARRVEKLAAAVQRLGSSELAELARGVQLLEAIIGSMRGADLTSKSIRLERRHRRTK